MATVSGPWTVEQVHLHLDEARIPVRLSFLDRDGYPRVLSLWFERRGPHLWCATQGTAMVARVLDHDDRVGFEVAGDEGPYCGVRGRGRARLHADQGSGVLGALIERYLAPDDPLIPLLQAQAAREVAIEIVPERWFSWDFSGRMGPTRD